MDIRALRVNSARAQQGAWIDNLAGMGDLRLKVRGFSNTDYMGMLARKVAAVPRDQREGGRRNGDLTIEARERVINECVLAHILIDWDGLTADGQTVPYSKEQATEFLTNPDFRPFRDAVFEAGTRVEEFEDDKVEAAVGNSRTASGGTSAGGRRRKGSAS